MRTSWPRRSAPELSQRRAGDAPGIDTPWINRLQQQPLAGSTPTFNRPERSRRRRRVRLETQTQSDRRLEIRIGDVQAAASDNLLHIKTQPERRIELIRDAARDLRIE